MMRAIVFTRESTTFIYGAIVAILLTVFLVVGVSPNDAHAATTVDPVQSVDTGDGTTCAIRKNRAYCWGQDILYGYKNYDTKTTPQLVTSSAISNKLVSKVTVGVNHACLLAAAKVYCWGLNNNGQLGDGSTTDRSAPTPVDTSTALKGAEIMDVSAGDGFTCALATSGVVSCWGSRADGRIGAGNGMSGLELYPKTVDANGSLSGKKAIRLARASNATMCAIVTPTSNTNATSGDVHCWGFGINNGNSIPGSTTTGCLDAAPATTTTYFKSDKPVLIPGATATNVVGQLGDTDSSGVPVTGYMSAVTTASTTKYWGRSGYIVTYRQGAACTTPPPVTPPPVTPPPVTPPPVTPPPVTPPPVTPPPVTPPPVTPPPVVNKCTNAYWGFASGDPITPAAPSSGSGRSSNPGLRVFIPQMKSQIRLARLNISTGSPQGPGNHNQQNSQGQNVGGGGNNNSSQQTTFTVTVYHLCTSSSGSLQYVRCNTSWPASMFSPTGGEKASVIRTQTGMSNTGRGSTPTYSYSGVSGVTCDPSLNPNSALASLIALPLNLIQGKTMGVQPDSRTTNTRSPLMRLAASTTKYTYVSTITPVGQISATTPPTYPTTKSGIKLIAGTAYEGNNGGLICVVETSAGTFCDGHGTSTLQGQLGNNNFAQQSGPKLVYDATQSQAVTSLSSAGNYTCAVNGGYLECWGANSSGQLGIGNTSNQSKPMRVTSWQ